MILTYAKKPFYDDEITDIDVFYKAVREALFLSQGRPRVVVLDISPGDMTCYRICVSIDKAHVVVSMLKPQMYVYETLLGEDFPKPWDLTDLRNEYTRALLGDVMAIVQGLNHQYYDYEQSVPKWVSDARGRPATAEQEAAGGTSTVEGG